MALAIWALSMNCSPGRVPGVEDAATVGDDTGEGDGKMVVAVEACEITLFFPGASFDKPVAIK